MTATAVALLLGIVGLVVVAVGLPVTIVRARRMLLITRQPPASALLLPMALGFLLVLSVTAVVGAVLLG